MTNDCPRSGAGISSKRREVQDPPHRGGLVGHRAHPLAPGAQDLGGALDREGEHPGVELVDRVELELDGGDDAEVAAPAAHGPEEVGLVVGVGDDDAPVGGDDLHGHHAVGGEAVLARQPAQAAAEAVADDADVMGGAGQRGEPVLGGGAGDVGPDRAGLGAGAAALGVDLDDAHAVRLDQDGVVQRSLGEGGRGVAGALGGNAHAARRAGELHDGDDVRHGLGLGDGDRALVDGQVPGLSCGVPTGVAGYGDRAHQLLAQRAGVQPGGGGAVHPQSPQEVSLSGEAPS